MKPRKPGLPEGERRRWDLGKPSASLGLYPHAANGSPEAGGTAALPTTFPAPELTSIQSCPEERAGSQECRGAGSAPPFSKMTPLIKLPLCCGHVGRG